MVGVLVGMLLLAGCAQPATEDTAAPAPPPEPQASPAVDGPAPPPTGAAQPPAGGTAGAGEVTVWFAREHESGVWVEPTTVPLDEETVEVLRAVVEAVLQGPSTNPDLTTVVPEGTELLDVSIQGGIAHIDLSREVLSTRGGAAEERALAQQLAQSATQFPTVDAVRLLVEGELVDELWGHVDWSQPLVADPQTLAPIIIDRPPWGASRPPGPVTASGTSVTFESTVLLRLIDPQGTVVEDTFTTAAQPDVGQRGPWEHTFDAPATTPGAWTIEALEPDPSDGEGRPPFTTSVRFEVS